MRRFMRSLKRHHSTRRCKLRLLMKQLSLCGDKARKVLRTFFFNYEKQLQQVKTVSTQYVLRC